MIEKKICLNILIGILFYTSRANGQLEINLPGSGNYNERTEMNCTDPSFDIAKGYIWYKDNIQIYDNINGDATSTGKYTSTYGAGFFTLVITNTALDDNGVYRCNYNFQDKTDMLEIQAKGDGQGKLDGTLKITLTEFYPGNTTVLSVDGSGVTFPGTQTVTAAGDLFTIVWTSNSGVDSSNVKKGCDVTIQSATTYVIHVDVEATTTMPTTTSISTSSSTAPTSSSTTPTSTSTTTTLESELTAITHTTASATAISTTSTTSLITKAKSETTTASADSSKSETVVITVASVVGGLFVVGIVITIVMMLLSQHKRRKHVSRGIHTYKENRNNMQFERSKFLSSQGYSKGGYRFDGKSSGNQFKQNPVFVRQSNRPVTYQYQPRNGNYRQNSYALRYIYPGFTDGDQYSGRYTGQDRRINEAPNYYNSCNLRRHNYSHPYNPQRSKSRIPVRETLHTDDQNYVVSDYSMYW